MVESAPGKVGAANFDGRLEICSYSEGLRVSGMGMLGLMTKPFFILWSELHETEALQNTGEVELSIGQSRSETITLENDLWESLRNNTDTRPPQWAFVRDWL